MIDQASAINSKEIEFVKIDEKLPFDDSMFDVALLAHVFVEVSGLEQMQRISDELHRVLKVGGILVIITNNSKAIGCDYLSYSYPRTAGLLVSGEKIPCTIKKGNESFVINDYYWSEEDYKKVLKEAGFAVSMTFPKVDGKGWLGESRIAPHVVIKATK